MDWGNRDVRECRSMICKATDLCTVSESFTCTLKAYQFETRKQKTDLLVAVNHSTTMSLQLETAMQEVNAILGCAREREHARHRGVPWWLYKGGVDIIWNSWCHSCQSFSTEKN